MPTKTSARVSRQAFDRWIALPDYIRKEALLARYIGKKGVAINCGTEAPRSGTFGAKVQHAIQEISFLVREWERDLEDSVKTDWNYEKE